MIAPCQKGDECEIHRDHETESETVIERSWSRRKRAIGSLEYTVDIEISFPDPSFANQIKQFIATNLTFPIPLGSNDTEIESISVTTACNQTGSSVQCSCESGYVWPDSVCTSYTTCPGSNASSCDCIQGTTVPAQYCQPKPVSINLCITFFEEFTADFKDPTSQKYVKFKADLESQLTEAYKSLSGFQSATVTGFRPGSIIADYTVVTEPVSPSTVTAANSQLINNLRSANYSVDPSIRTIVTNKSSITVTPSSIFSKDTVYLTCIVNISSYASVTWYLNGTEAIQNTSYTTTATSGAVESILKINSVSLSNSGTYLCVIDDSVNSYQIQTTIAVQPLEIKILTTDIACNKMEVPIIECCTQGLSMDFAMTCVVKSGIVGIARNNTPCKTYHVEADGTDCARYHTGSYDCTCSTMYGANETGNVKVIYQDIYSASVTSKADIISEGKELTMQCNCNATSVRNISWYFQNVCISSQYYTSNLTTCSSTLTIPSNVTTVAWNGMYDCSVDTVSQGILTARKAITIARLINPSQISRSPLAGSFLCNKSIEFRCCISNTTGYKGANLQIITKSGISLPPQAMTMTSSCFNATYTPVSTTECVDFKARCTITNRIDDTVSSDYMELTYLKVMKTTKYTLFEFYSSKLFGNNPSQIDGSNNYLAKIIADIFSPWHLNAPDQQTEKTYVFIEVVKLADNQFIKGI
ncbi:hypothetical protein GDO78_017344 [Eleutherodactylus coqui]|uniref:Uncharacterized protein n=1 Tax=Eleutherodactylus coqui TaxID=57060 RepID=A0A8J6BF18_ELECQ|nr:hypothetical protein GDO78_017344 [Eleutherodactylus coqui]